MIKCPRKRSEVRCASWARNLRHFRFVSYRWACFATVGYAWWTFFRKEESRFPHYTAGNEVCWIKLEILAIFQSAHFYEFSVLGDFVKNCPFSPEIYEYNGQTRSLFLYSEKIFPCNLFLNAFWLSLAISSSNLIQKLLTKMANNSSLVTRSNVEFNSRLYTGRMPAEALGYFRGGQCPRDGPCLII